MNRISVLIYLLISPLLLIAQQEKLFKQSDGLSNTSFSDFFQDSKGIVWIATEMGLNKFDGYTFEVFNPNYKDTTSLSSIEVKSIFEDSKGRLWVGTAEGLQIYDRKLNNFINYPIYFNNKKVFIRCSQIREDDKGNIWVAGSHGLLKINPSNNYSFYLYKMTRNGEIDCDNTINTMLLDKNRNLWLGTNENGLIFFSPYNNKIERFTHNPANPESICDNTIQSLCQDDNGNIISGNLKGGISIFNITTKRFFNIPFSNDPNNKFNGGVLSLIHDKKGIIWVGTERNGLKKLDSRSYKLSDANSLINLLDTRDSKVRCFKDKDHNLWMGVDYEGIIIKKANSKPFHTLNKDSQDEKQISHNIVKAILEDSNDDLWVGTDGGGLNWLGHQSGKPKYYDTHYNSSHSISDNAILSLCEDNQNNLWIGSYLGGLSKFDRKAKAFTNYQVYLPEERRSFNFVNSVISTAGGNLWLGTNGGSLIYFDTKTKIFTRQKYIITPKNNIDITDHITVLFIDRDSSLWIGSYNGLFYWNQKNGIGREYSKRTNRLKYTDGIHCIYQDKKGDIWLGTNIGLCTINKKSDKITTYSIVDGLPSNSVYSILEDDHENLWVSTSNGLSKFDSKRKTFKNYSIYDGLPNNEFLPNASFKSKDGKLYFGSTSGLVYFYPDSILETKENLNLIFTNLKLFNENISVGNPKNDQVLLKRSINETDIIRFNYNDNSFTLEFAGVDYSSPEKIVYKYKMDGFDQDWIYTDHSRRYATYTNLGSGSYNFILRSTNRDGIWGKDYRTIQIIIAPPYYKTWWAYLIYIIFGCIICYFIKRLIVFRLKMFNDLKLERLEREKIEELNHSKMQFFSNVSHEFMTPLSLIINPVEKLLSVETNPTLRRQISLVHQNSKRMLRLVTQLLDLQKVENNQMFLRARSLDIIDFTKTIMKSFEELANRKNIHFEFESFDPKLYIWFDPDKLDKILFNLISNAFKFTPDEGSIQVKIVRETPENNEQILAKHIVITIADTGKGIGKEYLEKIFERFYQVENKQSSFQIGTGLGLHLTKSLVELHRGYISVESKPDAGSSFIVRLPMGTSHLQHDEIVEDTKYLSVLKDDILDFKTTFDSARSQKVKTKHEKSHKILIVEDDFDIRTYIAIELSERYEVMEASDGEEGLGIARKNLPDLIISDIAMPKMDGVEMTRYIKEDLTTSHIPIILLSARSSIEHKMEGFETGADDYIPKPFHLEYLTLRIKKLIETRENLKQKFSKTISFDAKEMTITSADEKFLQKAIDFVKENISNQNVSIEDMGQKIGISRVHLYRKLKSLTDQSPTEFIRTIRLKQGAYLLSQKKLSISEVAYKVGFNSLQYFSNSFHDYFNMSPSQYYLIHNEEKAENGRDSLH